MDEFGETPTIYVWPTGHNEGDALPGDFWERVGEALRSAGFDWETV